MASGRFLKEVRYLAEQLGLRIVKEDARGSGHTMMTVQNNHGIEGRVTVSKSPSDKRSMLNLRADLRRIAKAQP